MGLKESWQYSYIEGMNMLGEKKKKMNLLQRTSKCNLYHGKNK